MGVGAVGPRGGGSIEIVGNNLNSCCCRHAMNLSYEVLTNNEFRISLFTNAGRLYESGEETRAAERAV